MLQARRNFLPHAEWFERGGVNILRAPRRRSCAQDSNVSAFPHSVARGGIRKDSSVSAAGCAPCRRGLGREMTDVKSSKIRPPTIVLAPDAETTPEVTAPASAELGCLAARPLGEPLYYNPETM
jgi:hypothetical protein